jgi:hypothetical protein
LDSNWVEYLRKVCGTDEELFLSRKARIDRWIEKKELVITSGEVQMIENAFDEVNAVLSGVIHRLRTSCA